MQIDKVNSETENPEPRCQAGAYFRDLRLSKGLSQGDMAKLAGIKQYNFISQIEKGRKRVPPDAYVAYAKILGVDPREFVIKLMFYYDPLMYRMLFDAPEETKASSLGPTDGA